jgi:hypothetical protein
MIMTRYEEQVAREARPTWAHIFDMSSFARRYLSLALPLVSAALLLTGCAGTQTPSTTPTAVTTLGNQPSTQTPTLVPTLSPSMPSPPTSALAPASYPIASREYAEAVIAAWKTKNLSKLVDLTTPQVQEQLIEIPGPPNMNWTYVRSDGAMGSTYCSFINADGDKLTLRVTNEKLGHAHAVSNIIFEQ